MSELDPALLLQRVRAALPNHALEEKRMFGGGVPDAERQHAVPYIQERLDGARG